MYICVYTIFEVVQKRQNKNNVLTTVIHTYIRNLISLLTGLKRNRFCSYEAQCVYIAVFHMYVTGSPAVLRVAFTATLS